MPRACLFCGEKATTKEHAWPEWIAKQLGLEGFLEMAFQGGHVEERKQPISVKSYRRMMLCGGCQEHYARLEDRVIPILLPMAQGDYSPLWAYERATLAEWGAKTAYTVFDFHGLTADVPQEHRYMLRETGKPVGDVFVGFARYQGQPRSTFHFLPLDPRRISDDPTPSGYSYVAAFGHVAVKVFGLVGKELGDVVKGDPGLVYEVFPGSSEDVIWPVGNRFVGHGLVRLAMYVPVPGRMSLWEWPVTHE